MNYDLVQRNIDETQNVLAGWSDFDRAIEVLAAHVNPVKSRESNRRKALTIKDLLIKVRIYPAQLRCTRRCPDGYL